MSELIWKPIAEAPMDGRPVLVRGDDYGIPSRGKHMNLASYYEGWNGPGWYELDNKRSCLTYLTEYAEY